MGSCSLTNPTYWWYQARDRLFRTVFESCLEEPFLDVGSADGPSVTWVKERTTLDVDPAAQSDVVASVLDMPFDDNTYATVGVFDVIEHVDDAVALAEIRRVMRPGGSVLVSVPAYQWAWTGFDVKAGHQRRYTKRRLVSVLEKNGFLVERASYVFTATFPCFAVDRVTARFGLRESEDPSDSGMSGWVSRVLTGLCRFDAWWLARWNLPFGSSVVAIAKKEG